MADYKLYHGDCTTIMPSDISSKSVDAIVTDIPYNVVNRNSGGLRNLDKGVADVQTFSLNTFVSECARVLSGTMYVFCSTIKLR